jgi:pyruvate dehydrogenase E2 component (dihydrolipoamide acetyltransferase)
VDAVVAAVKGNAGQIGQNSQKDETSKPVVAEQQTAVTTAQPQTSNSQQQSTSNGRLKASPLAKRLAKEKGIDIKAIHGSGDGGRIIKSDIDNYKAAASSAGIAAASAPSKPAPVFAPVAGEEGYTDIPNSQIRSIIAKRLAESKFSAPHFYLTMEINMDNCISARTQLNEVSPVKISFNDMVVKAAALALRQHPAVNAS